METTDPVGGVHIERNLTYKWTTATHDVIGEGYFAVSRACAGALVNITARNYTEITNADNAPTKNWA